MNFTVDNRECGERLLWVCLCLTVGGADEGEAGDDPEEGHGDADDDVLKV